MLCSSFHDNLANKFVTGVEDMVPSFSQQLSRLRNTTIDNFDTALNKK
jgi:hypothetical protein